MIVDAKYQVNFPHYQLTIPDKPYIIKKGFFRNLKKCKQGYVTKQIKIKRLIPTYFVSFAGKQRTGNSVLFVKCILLDFTGFSFLYACRNGMSVNLQGFN